MKNFAAVAVGALLGATMYVGAADAASVTLNPSGVGLSANLSFQTDNATIANNAIVTFDNAGNFTETGFFRFTSFNTGGSPVNNTGLGSNYNIYGTFTAQGGSNGTVTSLTFTLFGDAGADNTFSTTGTSIIDGTGNDIVLGTGSLLGIGTAIVVPPFNDPANLTLIAGLSFTPNAGASGFFVSPNPFDITLQIAATVTPDASESTCGDALEDCTITISGGGGNISFRVVQVPEPATLGLLGVGLIGFGALRRRIRA